MSPIEIKIELMKRRIKMADIGRQLNVSAPAIQRVIERDSVSERIMMSISKAIYFPPETVFPEHQFRD